MNPIILVGYTGKMSKALQTVFETQKLSFRVLSAKAPASLQVSDFKGSAGVIDFSLPNATEDVLKRAVEAKVPYVCGTTGFASKTEIDTAFSAAAQIIPIVRDSNFSLGVELLCQASELLARSLSTGISITDIHHTQKRDAPSGTALKIRDRMLLANAKADIKIDSIRIGEVFGEHRILASFQDQTIEFIHRANSRRPFAEGSLKALQWAQKQKPGLYTMKDVLQ